MTSQSIMKSQTASGIGRRDFLTLGCTGLVSLPFVGESFSIGPVAMPALIPQGRDRSSYEVSLGFVDSRNTLTDFPLRTSHAQSIRSHQGTESGPTPILDPSSFSSGDSGFLVRDANLTIHGGVSPASPSEWDRIEGMSIEVDYAPFQPVRFSAWTYDNRGVLNQGSSSSFVVPISKEFGLNLYTQLQVRGRTMEFRSQLHAGSTRNSNKLRRGDYILLLTPSGQSQPRTLSSLKNVAGLHLLISIDYGDGAAVHTVDSDSLDENVA